MRVHAARMGHLMDRDVEVRVVDGGSSQVDQYGGWSSRAESLLHRNR